MDKSKINILDCTFRDGGYYTNWIFNNDIINSYLELLNQNVCDIVELGMRTINSSFYLGPYAYSNKEFLNYCCDFKNLKFSVLVNWNDIKNSEEEFRNQFPGINSDFASIVRIATRFEVANKNKNYLNFLKNNGYTVSLNIQNCDQLLEIEKSVIIKTINNLDIDILYLADTNGVLNPEKIRKIINLFKYEIKIPIGVHMHNNQGLALANTIEALNSGATFLDSTISGIGRGPGNTQTEYLSNIIKNLSMEQKVGFAEIISNFFQPLKQKYLWGDNYYYFLSGQNNQDASLMHESINNRAYSNESIVYIASSEKSENISKSLKETTNKKIFKIRKPTAAIIANGSNWRIEESQILNYLRRNNLCVTHINYPKDGLIIPYLDYFCSCDPIRIREDYDKYMQENKVPLICPNNILNNLSKDYLNLNTNNYDCIISEDLLKINALNCYIPHMQSLCYALCFLYSKGYKNIILAGVQGFNDTKKNMENINCLNQIKIIYPELEITSLNENCLGINSKSIFELKSY